MLLLAPALLDDPVPEVTGLNLLGCWKAGGTTVEVGVGAVGVGSAVGDAPWLISDNETVPTM